MTPATPVLYTPAPNSQRNITDDHRQEPSIVAALPAVGVEDSPGFCHGTSDESSTTVAGEVTNAQRAGTSSSLGHVARSQPGPVVFPNNQDLPEQQQEQQQQSPAVQVVDQIPLLTQPRSVDQDFSIFDADFDGYNYPSQGILDDFNLIACWTSEPTPPGATEEAAVKPGMLFSENQVQQLRPPWRGQRAVPGVRVSSSLWRSVVHHQADNIFARRKLPENCQAGSDRGDCGTDNWGVDNICRTAMIDFCKELEGGIRVDGLPAFTPIASYNTEHEQAIPGSLTDDFPGIGLVEASIDVFFQLNHLPFLHKATFDARAVPVSLLLPILLIGFSSLYPERSKSFVLRCMQLLIGRYRSEIDSKALAGYSPTEFLVSTASTLLVVYLSLGYLEDLDEFQAHMLCTQMLHAVERQGLFDASGHDNLFSQLQESPADDEGFWKSWARAESIKRMIGCLLWMDLAYTRLMGGTGVVDINEVELYQPCDDALFDAPNPAEFLQLEKDGSPLVMPRSSFHNFYIHPLANLNHFSIETALSAWYLQIAIIRHALPIHLHARSQSPAEFFPESRKARDVVNLILMLPSRFPNLLQQRHRTSAFAWHNVLISLTVDLDLLEIASGRDGPELARTAFVTVSQWAETPGARRAALHAAHIFDILSSSRLGESNIARPDLLLFNSALVLSMYLFASRYDQGSSNAAPFELIQDVDWTSLGQEGLLPSSGNDTQGAHDPAWLARNFIRHGGPVSFAGELQRGSGVSARRILLKYMCLLDDFGRWRESRYSHLLRAMSDCIIGGHR